MKRFRFAEILLLVATLGMEAAAIFGQTPKPAPTPTPVVVPFPTTDLCPPHGVLNTVQVGPDRPGGGGYSGDNVVEQCDWGPCSYNIVTHAIFEDLISVYSCVGRGRYPVFTPCDSHQSVSNVLVSPFRGAGLDTYIATDVYRGNCPTTSPTAQFYTIHNGSPSWTFGADANIQAAIGWTGSVLWINGSPCTKVDFVARTVTQGSSCPGPVPFDPPQKTDPQGRTWTKSISPNGIKVASWPSPSPTPTPVPITPFPSSTPTSTAIPTSPPTGTVTPTIPTPTPQYVCVTVTPAR